MEPYCITSLKKQLAHSDMCAVRWMSNELNRLNTSHVCQVTCRDIAIYLQELSLKIHHQAILVGKQARRVTD